MESCADLRAPRPAVPQPLRIAILVNPFTLGMKWGAHAPELARELLGLGHTVRGFGAPPGAIPRSGADPEVAGGPLAEEPVGVAGFQPDAIVAYDALSPAAWLGARTARRLGVPLVLVEAAAGIQRGRAWFLNEVGRLLWGRYVRSACSAVIALDAVARDRVLRAGFAPAQVSVLPAGVDLARFRPGLVSGLVTRHHIRGRTLLYVGRIGPGRGLDLLVRAFATTVGQRTDWSLVLAGEGPGRTDLRALVDRLGIGSRVHWVGLPREEELPGLLSASTLLAVPALDDSVRGLNITRAMAAGLPILASDRPSLRLLVQDGVQGLVVPAGDLRAWTDTIQRAAMSPEARSRWGAAGRRTAEERFAWPRVAQTFENLIVGVQRRGAAQRGPVRTEAALAAAPAHGAHAGPPNGTESSAEPR